MSNDEASRRLKQLCDPVKIEEMLAQRRVRDWQASWSEQPREECKRRMHFIIAMVTELNEILKTTRFSTMWCEMAIEDVIMGRTDDLKTVIETLSFNDEHEGISKRYAPVFEKFKGICEEALVVFQAHKE